MEVHDGGFGFLFSTARFSDKNRPGVARPAAIGRVRDEFDFSQIHPNVFEDMPCMGLVLFVPDDEPDV